MNNLLVMDNKEDSNNKAIESRGTKSNMTPFNIEITSKNDSISKNNKEESKLKIIFYIKIVIIIIYFALIICIEQLYRKNLFEKSKEIQEKIRDDHEKESSFYKFLCRKMETGDRLRGPS